MMQQENTMMQQENTHDATGFCSRVKSIRLSATLQQHVHIRGGGGATDDPCRLHGDDLHVLLRQKKKNRDACWVLC